ncbi:MAG: Fic family protein [Candidatus Dadabacteria bacterium]|nr:Fic family protein [Candidatus Dadabacteria bacterium]MDE0663829.1 Fic family protein [Candidatus Dadabacteria bacterium]
MKTSVSRIRTAGYAWLLSRFGLTALPNWHSSFVAATGGRQQKVQGGRVEDIYSLQYWPGEKIGDHLEFALKYDGVSLSSLKVVFDAVAETELVDYIKSKPTGKYARRIWFFFEFLTGRRLPIDDLSKGNYLEALEPDIYYTLSQGEKSQRHRVINNLLGPREFCPIVRKTEKLGEMDQTDFRDRCEKIVESYPPQLLRRVLSYLYSKETKSSFEIENIKPGASRTEKFIASLEMARRQDFCDKELLIALQNRIVDPRFINEDYRTVQNYVGQTISYQKELIHYVCPKPEDLPDLMRGLLISHRLMMTGGVSAIVHAAVVAYGFVFIHPFEDGNGRIHRFLIHNIFSIRGMVPEGLMFPVSAVMLNNPEGYDDSLEAFSLPLNQLVEYSLDGLAQMTVHNDTAYWYRYIDMTAQAEALHDFVVQTVESELVEELNFLASYDSTKKAIQDVIDMPDRLIDLFIRVCLENKGRLSSNKRKSHFDFLSDGELFLMESAVREKYRALAQ